MLSSEDINFISKKIKLSIKKTKTLIEDPIDLNLILDEISQHNFIREEFLNLSFELISRIVVFKFGREPNIDLSEKSYIADILIKHFPVILRYKTIRPIPSNPNSREFAEYCLILLGLFGHKVFKEKVGKYKSYVLNFYKSFEQQKTLHSNLSLWFKIFEKIRTEEIFE